MDTDSNLFVSLHRWAKGQDENYTTESFAYLLNHLKFHQPEIASRILDKLTHGAIPPPGTDMSLLEIETQNRVIWDSLQGKEILIPDIRIQIPGKKVLIEVKMSSGLDRSQVESYLELLSNQDRLVLLTRLPVTKEISEGTYLVRWIDIATWLENEPKFSEIDPTSQFLVNQFIEYLRWQQAAVIQIRTDLSQAIADYQKKGGNLFELDRYERLKELDRNPDLFPLRDLLFQMKHALENQGVQPVKLGSGMIDGNWIGWNINEMEYFFFVTSSQPEKVILQAYYRDLADKDITPEIGKLVQSSGRVVWQNELDLATPEVGFFGADAVGQIKIMVDFLILSLQYAEQITVPSSRVKHPMQWVHTLLQ